MEYLMDIEAYQGAERKTAWRISNELDGVRALLQAVLDRAVRDYLHPELLTLPENFMLRQWFNDCEIYCNEQEGFSLAYICEMLDIKQSDVLQKVKELSQGLESGSLDSVPRFRSRTISIA